MRKCMEHIPVQFGILRAFFVDNLSIDAYDEAMQYTYTVLHRFKYKVSFILTYHKTDIKSPKP